MQIIRVESVFRQQWKKETEITMQGEVNMKYLDTEGVPPPRLRCHHDHALKSAWTRCCA